ncbi:hypothetical protein Sango_1528100 [Sesamum angolense]|uniref:Uncharacterized protein n=1 Tax=Sesamum angolense TaxID=2727404 RepID=A0AAE1WP75_9LAMI|nr:hypothetical protein Sango_1528100 [Sesamum angolense]
MGMGMGMGMLQVLGLVLNLFAFASCMVIQGSAGLPLSPPLPPSAIGVIGSKPYPGHDNSSRTIQPLAVDIRRRQQANGLSRGMFAAIIVSASVAIALLCAIAWVLLHKTKDSVHQPDPPPPATIRSLAKSSVAMLGSGPSSPSFSLGSSMAAYTGSAKTFSSSDLEKATDYFNESRILGEGASDVFTVVCLKMVQKLQ